MKSYMGLLGSLFHFTLNIKIYIKIYCLYKNINDNDKDTELKGFIVTFR